jgi:hypothetical protein
VAIASSSNPIVALTRSLLEFVNFYKIQPIEELRGTIAAFAKPV